MSTERKETSGVGSSNLLSGIPRARCPRCGLMAVLGHDQLVRAPADAPHRDRDACIAALRAYLERAEMVLSQLGWKANESGIYNHVSARHEQNEPNPPANYKVTGWDIAKDLPPGAIPLSQLHTEPPTGKCDQCGRKTYQTLPESGAKCDFPQPDGSICSGLLKPLNDPDQL